MIKNIFTILLVSILLGGSAAFYLNESFASSVTRAISFSACSSPQSYKIGSIDERFGITHDELVTYLAQASGKWSAAYNKELFFYDAEKGDITVNLVYDDRQELTNQVDELHQEFEKQKETLESEKNALNQKKSAIAPQVAEFQARVQAFKERTAVFNQTVSYWNSRGGAPEEDYKKLQDEQQALKNEQAAIELLGQKINLSTEEYNQQVNEINTSMGSLDSTVGKLNSTVDTLNQKLDERPEEGLYNGRDNTITIYFMTSRDEFVHTLTHEFGHAIGIDHLKNKNAVMYEKSNDQSELTKDDISALFFACRERTIFDLAVERIMYLGEVIEKTFQQYDLIPK